MQKESVEEVMTGDEQMVIDEVAMVGEVGETVDGEVVSVNEETENRGEMASISLISCNKLSYL